MYPASYDHVGNSLMEDKNVAELRQGLRFMSVYEDTLAEGDERSCRSEKALEKIEEAVGDELGLKRPLKRTGNLRKDALTQEQTEAIAGSAAVRVLL